MPLTRELAVFRPNRLLAFQDWLVAFSARALAWRVFDFVCVFFISVGIGINTRVSIDIGVDINIRVNINTRVSINIRASTDIFSITTSITAHHATDVETLGGALGLR